MTLQIKLSSLRNGEFIQLFTEILSIVQENGPSALQVSVQHARLQALVAEAEALLNARRGHVLSEKLQKLDARRENALNGFQRILDGFSYSTLEAQRNAALLLKTHVSGFGNNIARDNYQSQTTMVRRLLSDFTTLPDLAAAVSLLGLEGWIAELSDANQQFATQFLARARDTGSASPESVRLKRTAVSDAWFTLRDRLQAYYTISEGAPPYAETIRFINGLMEYYNNLLARRANRSEAVEDPLTEDALPES
jgi:hypothetical protein